MPCICATSTVDCYFGAKHDWTVHFDDWSFGILELDLELPKNTTVFFGPPDWCYSTSFSAEAVVAIFAVTMVILIAGVSYVITKHDRSRREPAG